MRRCRERSQRMALILAALSAACGDNGSTSPGPAVASVAVTLAETMIEIGETAQASVELRDAGGEVLTGRDVDWSTSNTSIATVDAAGLVTPHLAGQVQVRASSGGRTGSASLSVFLAPTQPAVTIMSGGQPANLQNISGTIEFELNFLDGTLPVVSTELLVDGQVAAVMPGAPASLPEGGSNGTATEEQGVVIVLTLNTADIVNTDIGAPKFFNGPRQLSARQVLYGSRSRIWPLPPMVFNNAPAIVGTVTPQFTYPSSSVPGRTYLGGDLNVQLTPIIYSAGATMTSATVAFGPKPTEVPRPNNSPSLAIASSTSGLVLLERDALLNARPTVDYSFAVEQYSVSGSPPIDPQTQPSSVDVNRDGFRDSHDNVSYPAPKLSAAAIARYVVEAKLNQSLSETCTSGQFYSHLIEVSGGTGSSSVAIEGNLPPGLAYNAATKTISGTPAQAGQTTVDVVITDNEAIGLTNRRQLIIDCASVSNNSPFAAFISSCVQLQCQFDASASSDPDGHALTYSWNFGDGASGNGQITQHNFASTGTYPVTLTVADAFGGSNAVAHSVTVASGGGFSDVLYAANTTAGISGWVRNADGSLTSLGFTTNPAHVGASEFHTLILAPFGGSAGADGAPVSMNSTASAVAPSSAIFATYITSKEIVKWNVNPTGGLTEAGAFTFPEAPFQVGINPQQTCLSVPLQTAGTIQNLTANLAPTSQLLLASSFPTKVLFNPLHNVAYAVDGTKIHVLNANPATCALSETGTAPTFNNRREVALDPLGAFLHVLTFNPFGGATTITLQPLANGLPNAPPVVTALPAGAFQVVAHPTADVLYILEDIPRAIRKVTFNRATGVATVGSSTSASGADEVAFDGNAMRLYYTNVNSPSTGRICWFDLTAQGDLLGTPTCDSNPARAIDSDLLIITPPSPSGGLRIPR